MPIQWDLCISSPQWYEWFFFVEQLTVLNLLGRCSPKCDYNKTSMEKQKNDTIQLLKYITSVLVLRIVNCYRFIVYEPHLSK